MPNGFISASGGASGADDASGCSCASTTAVAEVDGSTGATVSGFASCSPMEAMLEAREGSSGKAEELVSPLPAGPFDGVGEVAAESADASVPLPDSLRVEDAFAWVEVCGVGFQKRKKKKGSACQCW